MKYHYLKYLFIIPLIILIVIQFKFLYQGISFMVFHYDKNACDNYRDYSYNNMSTGERIFYRKNIYYLNYSNSNNLDTVIKYSDKIDSMYISYKLKKSKN